MISGVVSIDCMASSSSSDGSCSSTDDTNYVVNIPSFSASKTGTYNCIAGSVWYKGTNNKVDRSGDGDIILTYGKIKCSLDFVKLFLLPINFCT